MTNYLRGQRGGSWVDVEFDLHSSGRGAYMPTDERNGVGFRVASIPEPSHWLLMALGGAALLARRARKATL